MIIPIIAEDDLSVPVYGNHQTCDGSNLLVEKVDMNASGGANYPGVTIPETATLGPAYLSVNNGGDFGDGNLSVLREVYVPVPKR